MFRAVRLWDMSARETRHWLLGGKSGVAPAQGNTHVFSREVSARRVKFTKLHPLLMCLYESSVRTQH